MISSRLKTMICQTSCKRSPILNSPETNMYDMNRLVLLHLLWPDPDISCKDWHSSCSCSSHLLPCLRAWRLWLCVCVSCMYIYGCVLFNFFTVVGQGSLNRWHDSRVWFGVWFAELKLCYCWIGWTSSTGPTSRPWGCRQAVSVGCWQH